MAREEFAVSRVNLYEQVADQLEEWMISGSFAEETKLPSEQALADEFSVSRNVIREALKLLKERGLVDLRNGTGSYITKPKAEKLSDVIGRMIAMDQIEDKAVCEAWMILATAVCREAAGRVTQEQLLEMEKLLEKMNCGDYTEKEYWELDFVFFAEIAEAVGNPLLEILVRAMKHIFTGRAAKETLMLNTAGEAVLYYEKIVYALKAHDPVMAEAAVREYSVFYEKCEKYIARTDSR